VIPDPDWCAPRI